MFASDKQGSVLDARAGAGAGSGAHRSFASEASDARVEPAALRIAGAGGPGGRSYESVAWFDSTTQAGVRFGVLRMSLGRRLDLARRIREIGRRAEFLEAGTDGREKIEAAALGAEIDREYLEWGLAAVEGFSIDGGAATPQLVIERGPMELATEILARVKAELGLTENERKN